MGLNDEYDYQGPSGSKKYGLLFGVGLVVLVIAGLVFGRMLTGKHAPTGKMPEVVMIKPLAPTPPPPPPPKVEPPKEMVQKMVEQTPIDHPEDKPEEPKDAPALTTSLTGPGNDGFGLSGGNGGGSGGGGHSQGSQFGWYAGEVQKTIQEALSRNPISSHAQ